MKSVLEGFIGTYTSRYSDLRGYWLHGQLPMNASGYQIDLLAAPPEGNTPIVAARRLAILRFKEQIAKSGLDSALVRSANLKINIQPEATEGWQGEHRSDGHMVEFAATAVMDNGYRYQRKRTVFIAPHNPYKESRRSPNNWGT